MVELIGGGPTPSSFLFLGGKSWHKGGERGQKKVQVISRPGVAGAVLQSPL